MDMDSQPIEPHLTPEAYARRRRLGEQFDRAALTPEEAIEASSAMLEDLQRDPQYKPNPGSLGFKEGSER